MKDEHLRVLLLIKSLYNKPTVILRTKRVSSLTVLFLIYSTYVFFCRQAEMRGYLKTLNWVFKFKTKRTTIGKHKDSDLCLQVLNHIS